VNGAILDLSLKLTSLQKSKAGPFDMCFCVGPFFSSSEERDKEIRSLLQPCKSQGKEEDPNMMTKTTTMTMSEEEDRTIQLPLPVYFCDVGSLPKDLTLPTFHPPADIQEDDAEISIDDMDHPLASSSSPLSSNNNGGGSHYRKGGDSSSLPPSTRTGIVSIVPNLYHLHGISMDQTQTADILNIPTLDNPNLYITVAFLPPNARMGSIQTATLESKTNHPGYIGCDLLLTSDWGQGMASSCCISQVDKVNLGGLVKVGKNSNHDGNDNDDDDNDGGEIVDTVTIHQVGSYDVAEVASQCRPRYHVAPSLHLKRPNESGVFIQSLPYANPPSAMASGIWKNYHTSRFLALCPVVDVETQKINGKSKKFIHALGIQPLWSMDRDTATAVPENTVIAPCPYTDESYPKDANGSGSGNHTSVVVMKNGTNVGLSQAQARRILSEQQGGGGGGVGAASMMQDYRWNIRNRKRPLEQDNMMQNAPMDSTNCTLFLHGLHNDVTGGATLNRDALLNAFGSRGCIRVRYPVSDGYPSYCFLDFETHEEARRCLELNGGQEEILGIPLTMKWSAGKRRVGQQGQHVVPPLPPPPPGHVGIYNGGGGTTCTKHQHTKNRLREVDAADSSSLFVHLDCPSMTEEIRTVALASVAEIAQKALEDAINADNGDDRVSADDEPALKVLVRPLQGRLNCGFLDFASHAAASMALATLTKSTDGGLLRIDADSSSSSSIRDEKLSAIKEIQLWWARPKDTTSGKNVDSKGFRFHSHHFPLDARKDCWFCLASPTCEKHLIVSVLDYCYITMPKGPMNQNHALIVPVNHSAKEEGNKNRSVIGAFLDPTPGVIPDIEKAKEKLRAYAREELNMDLFVFERAIPTRGGYHAHINCIPIEKGSGCKIIPTMLSLAASSNHGNGFELREIQNTDLSVTNILKNADEDELVGYFYAEVPVGGDGVLKRYLYMALEGEHVKDKKRQVPLQFGREVLAAVLGSDNLADWKGCVTSKEKEDEYTEMFRSSFAKFL
jgi:hypothetical protein